MTIVPKYISANVTTLKNRTISYIVIHYTAGVTSKTGSAANTAAWFANSAAASSADFVVDDTTIVQLNGDIKNQYTWHCGGSKYNTKGGSLYGVCKNSNSIGIEICSTNSTGKVTNANDQYWSYTDAVIEKARELVLYLMQTYGIDANHVVRHYDTTGKPCPGIIGWNADTGDESKWAAFKASLGGTYTSTVVSTEPAAVNYMAVVTAADGLNCRTGAGTSYTLVKTYASGTTLTITKELNGWGCTGEGWVSLSYVSKVTTDTTAAAVTAATEEDEDMTQDKFNEMFATAMNDYRTSLRRQSGSTWASSDHTWVIQNGIFTGSDELMDDGTPNYYWQDFLTREQAAAVMHRLGSKLGL